VGAIESIRDITAQKKLEEALRKSEENYRELVEKARSIIMRMDSSGRITFFNEYAEKFFGYSHKEILGRNVVGTIVPETENRRRDLGELLRDITVRPEKYTQYETESMCKDGRRVWISWTNAPVCDSDGKTSEILCIGNDVTERKIVERELREYRENLEELVQKRTAELQQANQQLGSEIVERKKSEEKIRSLNMLLLSAKMITESLLRAGTEQEIYQKTCELLAELDFIKFVWAGFIEKDNPGIKPVAWAGCEDGYLSEVKITWDDSKYGQGPLGKAIRTGTIHMVTDCETDPCFALWREAALKHDFQSIIALPIRYRDMVIGYFTVYSNRKNAFGAEEVEFLSQIAEDLAVGVKSLRLENELQAKNKQLQQAYAELKESEEIILQKEKMASIGQLAAGIAHEIKNPLAVILQGTDFVVSSVKDEYILDSLERVKKSVFRADNIIKGLLSYARQSDLKPEIADISLLIDECISLIKHQLTKKKIDISRQYNSVPKVVIDSNQMKQVFINILMNSIESMDQGRIAIELNSISENNSKFTQIRLSDEGPGIQTDILKKIFDPFFTTKRNTGGTGLGLSITRGIIEKHNGGIRIDSELGAGTTVTINLPAQQLQ